MIDPTRQGRGVERGEEWLRWAIAFFELPPSEPEPEDLYEQPVWIGPPDNMLGAALPISVVLAHTDKVIVAVTSGSAYPTGFEFTLSARFRHAKDGLDSPPHGHFHAFPRRDRSSEIPPELLRFGVECSDGSKATNLGGFPSGDGLPEGPLLIPHGGGGGGRRWDQELWLWPLPPPGPLAFVCEWPSQGIPLTRRDIEADLILEAAPRAETLWEEDAR